MKQFASILFFLTLALHAIGQTVFISDEDFRLFLQQNYPNCMSGWEEAFLDTTCAEVVNETYLEFTGYFSNFDASVVRYFTGLDTLIISGCDVGGMSSNSLPPSLRYFDCSDNWMQGIHDIPETTEYLDCSGNGDIELLPGLPTGLRYLDCAGNGMVATTNLPNTLEYLDCSSNAIEELPELPPNLLHLDLRWNYVTVLPELNTGLEYLDCGSNDDLQCLPSLPNSMTYLAADITEITCLPNLPSGLAGPSSSLPICDPEVFTDCQFALIVGRVGYDSDLNCQIDVDELGLANWVVTTDNGDFAITDSSGYYELRVDTGTHFIEVVLSQSFWTSGCPMSVFEAQVLSLEDTITDVDLPVQASELCHWLHVDIGSFAQRPCFNTNYYSVSYCNQGTEEASDVYIDVTFGEGLEPLSCELSWIEIGVSTYRFEIGELDVDECGSFVIYNSVDCSAELGSTVCTEAIIYPISPCLTPGLNWDGSEVSVNGECGSNSIEFEISNEGQGDMLQSGNYRVFRDNLLFIEDSFSPLAAGAAHMVSVPYDGAGFTVRLEADQSEDFPGNSNPRATFEGCGVPYYSSGQILPSQQDDLDDHVEIECNELTSAFDPNDKQVIPAGVGVDHIVSPENEFLEYRIRFQNTGSDTAFNIEILDVLPIDYVDVATFSPEASSHFYTVSAHANGSIIWHFDNILLPDSNINEPASHGFVKFKIRQKPGLPNGTVINNNAAIYFDYNAPIITNTAFITISDTIMWAEGVGIEEYPQINISVQPNPFKDQCMIQLDRPINGELRMLDMTGREVYTSIIIGKQHTINIDNLNPGIYTLRVIENGLPVGALRVSLVN